jgi:hypothetical protein
MKSKVTMMAKKVKNMSKLKLEEFDASSSCSSYDSSGKINPEKLK